MLTDILNFLSSQNIIIVGAVTCVCEVLVVIVNTYRQLKHQKQQVQTLGIKKTTSTSKMLVWSLNPLNLFRTINNN